MPEGPDASDLLDALESAEGLEDGILKKIQNAGFFDRTDIRNPEQLGDYKREKIESDYEGIGGQANNIYGALGWEPSYQSQINALGSAQSSADSAEKTSNFEVAARQTHTQLLQQRNQLDAEVAEQGKSDFQRKLDAVNASYSQQVAQADSIENKTYYSQGFRSQAEANAFADHLKSDAGKIHDNQMDSLFGDRDSQLQSGNERLNVQQLLAAGDTVGAGRAELQHELNDEQRSIDPHDAQRLQQFEKIRDLTLSNDDANAARQANSNPDALHGGGQLPANLADEIKRIDDTVTKMDKALSRTQTLVLLKD